MQRTFQAMVERAVLGERLHHVGPEAADRTLFHRDQDLVFARQTQYHVDGIEGLGKARVRDRRRKAVRGQHIGGRKADTHRRVPSESRATELPSRRMRPLPISSGTPNSGMSTPTPSPRG